MDNHFKIIIPLYNVEKWIKICLRSVKLQSYRNFQCIIIDDISTDNSVEIIRKEIEGDRRFKLVVNKEKAYALKNIYDGIESSKPKPEDIIVTLDGDDWLASKDVLKILNEVYSKESCWITYGSYAEYPSKTRGKFARKIPQEVVNGATYRSHEWCSSHLRTFKYHLWKQIRKEDLLDSEGKFYKMTWDLAFMFPMLEMSGNRSFYIRDILYIYNLGNPLNDHKIDNTYQRKLEMEIRNKPKYNLIISKTSANLLMKANRFDIAAKTLYGDNWHRNINTPFCKELYLEHLNVWNNFKEKEPHKNSPDDFIKSFDETLNSIHENGFDDKYKIPTINNNAINGAHRIASCIILDKEIKTYETDISKGQYKCDYEYFTNKRDFVKTGLREKYTDEMALEFCRRKNNLYAISLFPSHNVSYEDLNTKIKQDYNIVYQKTVELTKPGQTAFVHNLYYKESWIGTKMQNYTGVREKRNYCFSKGNQVCIILIEENDPEKLIVLKDSIRAICGVGKHSTHINDTQEETWRIASSVFNKNSVDFMNKQKIAQTPKFDAYFSQYYEMLKSRRDRYDFCIDSSAVLSAYGLRDCRDLDFLHVNNIESLSPDIECHNHESHYYRVDKNDIIYNPTLHFYLHGIKFTNLQVVKDMKVFRNEEKDKRDVKLINGVIQ